MKDGLMEYMRTYTLEKKLFSYEIGGLLQKQFGKPYANTLERKHILMIYVDPLLFLIHIRRNLSGHALKRHCIPVH